MIVQYNKTMLIIDIYALNLFRNPLVLLRVATSVISNLHCENMQDSKANYKVGKTNQ